MQDIDTLTPEQIKALKPIQWLSFNYEERSLVERIAFIHATDARDLMRLGETISVVREWQHGALDVIKVTGGARPAWGSGWYVNTPYGLMCIADNYDTSG
jgi:hypothetical protein